MWRRDSTSPQNKDLRVLRDCASKKIAVIIHRTIIPGCMIKKKPRTIHASEHRISEWQLASYPLFEPDYMRELIGWDMMAPQRFS
jgi:hypothetical protein